MGVSDPSAPRWNFVTRCWKWFWGPARTISLGVLLIVGFGGGIIFWGGFNWAMELSNTETFCISCHEMRDTVFPELKTTIHYRTGEPGWHFIDLYPAIYKGKERRPRNFRLPQLTFADDHPGEDLPRFRFAFEVALPDDSI